MDYKDIEIKLARARRVGWPPALDKATYEDGDYCLWLANGGGNFEFSCAGDAGDGWVIIYSRSGEMKGNGIPFFAKNGIEIRISSIIMVIDGKIEFKY